MNQLKELQLLVDRGTVECFEGCKYCEDNYNKLMELKNEISN